MWMSWRRFGSETGSAPAGDEFQMQQEGVMAVFGERKAVCAWREYPTRKKSEYGQIPFGDDNETAIAKTKAIHQSLRPLGFSPALHPNERKEARWGPRFFGRVVAASRGE
jgi:hypothetical protein